MNQSASSRQSTGSSPLRARLLAAALVGIVQVSPALAQNGLPDPAAPTDAAKVSIQRLQGSSYGQAVAALPNWNGVWQLSRSTGLVFDPATAENFHDTNRGTDFGGPGGQREHPPYNAAWEADYDKRIAEHKAGRAHDPGSDCVVEGFPRLLVTPAPIEIIVLPKVVFMNWSFFGQTRRIYTDGRSHPPRSVAYPRELGHSIGHWEGDTLVVDTVDMRAYIYDQTEAPFSEKIHTVERIRLLDNGKLEDSVTIEDPIAFTKTWHVVRLFDRASPNYIDASRPGADWQDVETTFCTLNRNASDANGVNSAQLPGEPR